MFLRCIDSCRVTQHSDSRWNFYAANSACECLSTVYWTHCCWTAKTYWSLHHTVISINFQCCSL